MIEYKPIPNPLPEETATELERLSALRYRDKDIAMYFNWDMRQLERELENPESVVSYHVKRGRLVLRANIDMELAISAEGGNITAIQQLQKSMREKEFDDMLDDLGS